MRASAEVATGFSPHSEAEQKLRAKVIAALEEFGGAHGFLIVLDVFKLDRVMIISIKEACVDGAFYSSEATWARLSPAIPAPRS